ncbi:MAG: hypothetical protein M0D55_04125 [Elusimicrobiota bacterium]|nr:MAG: hypothetical protein M0D55_04125 [Elusimicrobiota bacterium]
MKSLSLIAVAAVSLAGAALSGCSSCAPAEETAKAPPPVTCGAGTIASGNTCVAVQR